MSHSTNGHAPRPQAADGLPDRMPGRRQLRARPGRRGPDPVRRAVRAPPPPVHRPGLGRPRRPRPDHRRQQADAPGPRPDAPFRRPGADDPTTAPSRSSATSRSDRISARCCRRRTSAARP